MNQSVMIKYCCHKSVIVVGVRMDPRPGVIIEHDGSGDHNNAHNEVKHNEDHQHLQHSSAPATFFHYLVHTRPVETWNRITSINEHSFIVNLHCDRTVGFRENM